MTALWIALPVAWLVQLDTAEVVPLKRAMITLLCFPPNGSYSTGISVGWGSPGFFSQLNNVADRVMAKLYEGKGPLNTSTIYGEKMIGYGGLTLDRHFHPFSCETAVASEADQSLSALLKAPRYHVASNILHILYRPLQLPTTALTRYRLALHMRRGDKLTEARASEAITVWDEARVVQEVRRTVEADKKDGEAVTTDVLVASDDNAFSGRVEAQLSASGVVVPHRLENPFDKGSTPPFDSCDERCIAPLMELMAHFAMADRLLLSCRSNMGIFLLSWWGAANHDKLPKFVDTDGKYSPKQMATGKFVCHLSWGTRRGYCRPGENIQLNANGLRVDRSPGRSAKHVGGGGSKGFSYQHQRSH